MTERHVQRFTNRPEWSKVDEPHLVIGRYLQVWTFGKTAAGMPGAMPERTDGTWVRVIAAAYPEGKEVRQTTDIRLADIDRHGKACELLLGSGAGRIVFDALAPTWTVSIEAAPGGKFTVKTAILSAGSTVPLQFAETIDTVDLRMQTIECQDILRRLA